ncbi:MAG: DedA family protein [Phototrophicaceae bacterium]
MLAPFVENLSTFIEQIVLRFGVLGIGIIAFMENIFPPTPSEFIYPLAGKLAYDGDINLFAVMLAGALGSIVGAFVFYHVGYYLGAERARRFIERYGTLRIGRWQIAIFKVEAYDRAMSLFDKHGNMIVMIARTLPLVHGIISIPAGINRMNLPKFLFYSFMGALLWIVPTVLLGYFLGSQWDLMLGVLDAYETLWYIVFAIVIFYYVFSRWIKRPRPNISDNKG